MGNLSKLVAYLSTLAAAGSVAVGLLTAYLALVVVMALTADYSGEASRRAAALDVLRVLLLRRTSPREDDRRPTCGDDVCVVILGGDPDGGSLAELDVDAGRGTTLLWTTCSAWCWPAASWPSIFG